MEADGTATAAPHFVQTPVVRGKRASCKIVWGIGSKSTLFANHGNYWNQHAPLRVFFFCPPPLVSTSTTFFFVPPPRFAPTTTTIFLQSQEPVPDNNFCGFHNHHQHRLSNHNHHRVPSHHDHVLLAPSPPSSRLTTPCFLATCWTVSCSAIVPLHVITISVLYEGGALVCDYA